MRKVIIDDFKDSRTIHACYMGYSKELVYGQWYNIRFMEKRKRVSIPLCDNPDLGKSNSGMEFSMGKFYIK